MGWPAGGSVADGLPSGRKWQGTQSCQGVTELGFPGPTLWQMQSEAARRVGEPSVEGEEAPSQGYPRSAGAPSCRFTTLTQRPPSVDSG